MNKKEYLLRNKIVRAVLVAVLAQSLFFGVVLLSLQGFSELSRQPYETMRVRLADKSDAISGTMNNIYLEGAGLKRQMKTSTKDSERHTLLVDTLNRSDYLSSVTCIDIDANQSVAYMDSEPQEYSVTAADISCIIGTTKSEIEVSMSNKWRKNFSAEEQAYFHELSENRATAERWFYSEAEQAFGYTLQAESGGHRYLVFLMMKEAYLKELLDAENMYFVLGNTEGAFFGKSAEVLPVTVTDTSEAGYEQITWTSEGEKYIGYRERAKIYGDFRNDDALYIMVLGKKSDLQAPVLEMLWKILVAYAVSIAVCFAASWVATGVVLKPLKKMLEDIKKQRGRVMHFEEGEIIEIKSIYSALNDMTKRLEESYSRYDFTMEEVERNLGSFTYHCDTEMTDVSRAVQEILCIPEEYITREREVSVENWERIKEKLTPFHELNAYTFTDAENNVHCVSFKTKEEEKGVFGVVMDKTVEYKKISQLKFVSEHDYMTKLYNASYMKEQGEKLLEKHRGKVNAMMFCDLDNLKYVNDHYGHSMGDAYIIAMADKMNWLAERITMSCPDVDIIAARISGDEFAMLFTGFGAKEDIQEALIDLHERRSFISITNDEEYSVRVSIGFVYESDEVNTVEALLKCADIAMYSIKSRGKNGIAMYVDESNTKDVIFSGAEEQESV